MPPSPTQRYESRNADSDAKAKANPFQCFASQCLLAMHCHLIQLLPRPCLLSPHPPSIDSLPLTLPLLPPYPTQVLIMLTYWAAQFGIALSAYGSARTTKLRQD